MTASVLHLLDSLESRLEQAQAELHTLRMENAQLKQQLVGQAATLQRTLDQPSVAMQSAPDAQAQPTQVAEIEPPVMEGSRPEPVQQAGDPDAVEAEITEQEDPAAAPPSPHSLLKEWYQRYPEAFFKGHTKPLKVGIHQDLAAREPWSGKLIRRTLANYVNLPRYLKSVREGVDRIDLDGQSAGKVDKEAALHAAQKRKEKQGDVDVKSERQPGQKTPSKESAYKAKQQPKPEFTAPRAAITEKRESKKPISLEDKLKGLQQKFEGH
ncbi:ProP effector [Vreelandella songnenensis]|uniref:ProP effector n=1 Tax=Vreelandella songnenensis TaxID=1176243 RepID=A0A2T0V8I1_9GAMM|nr:ProQ/FINO family protein [Halomonas songnenensis]PRY66358.1 ProP effector [Halomonas songnenensis]